MTLRSFSVEEISRLEAMLTFLSKKVPAVRNPTSRQPSGLNGTESHETLAGRGFPENAPKSRMIINSYTAKKTL
jgi:hypothetical protein